MTTIDVTLDPPNPLTDSQTTFNSKSLAFTQALTPWAAQVNTVAGEVNTAASNATASASTASDYASDAADQVALATAQKTLAQGYATDATNQAALAAASAASAVNAPGTSATSATSRTIAVGSVTLTIQTGKAYAVGQFVVIASTASPANYMAGQVTAHNSGTGSITVNATQISGDGTFSDWVVSVVGAPGNWDAGAIIPVAALDIDCSLGAYFTKSISASSTLTFSNAPTGKVYAFTLELTHTSGTITWPASVKWPADTAPVLTTGKTHLFTFVTDDGGTSWYGVANTNYTT